MTICCNIILNSPSLIYVQFKYFWVNQWLKFKKSCIWIVVEFIFNHKQADWPISNLTIICDRYTYQLWDSFDVGFDLTTTSTVGNHWADNLLVRRTRAGGRWRRSGSAHCFRSSCDHGSNVHERDIRPSAIWRRRSGGHHAESTLRPKWAEPPPPGCFRSVWSATKFDHQQQSSTGIIHLGDGWENHVKDLKN